MKMRVTLSAVALGFSMCLAALAADAPDPAILPPVYTAAHCDLLGTLAPKNGTVSDALPDILKNAYKQIGASCDGILVIQDSTPIVINSWQQCCRMSDKYLRSKPAPTDPDALARYRVGLAMDVCDALNTHQQNYESDLCLNEMLFRIDNAEVQAISNECSPIGHHVGGGGGRHGGGHGGGGTEEAKAEASPSPSPSPSAAWSMAKNGRDHNGYHGKGKEGGTSDLLLNDESFSSCQHRKLRAFLSSPMHESKQEMN